MSCVSRRCWCFLILSLSIGSLPPAFSASTVQSPADEAPLRALAENLFNAWAAKDLDGFLRLWSAKSPELEARRKSTAEFFAGSGKITLKSFTVRRIKTEGNQAQVRVDANVEVIDAKTGKDAPEYGKWLRVLECVREEGGWKVWREASAFEQLAAALAAAETEQEQAARLSKTTAEEPELLTAQLVRAVIDQGSRLYEQGNFRPALVTQRLAHKLAEQLEDQPGIARALNCLGNVYWAQGDYAPAQENFRQSMALSEKLNDRVAVAGTLRNLGNLQYVQGNWMEAAELFRKGMQLSESLGDRLGVARGLGSLGVVSDSLGDGAQALAYYQQSLKQFEALKDNAGMARTLGNIAIVHEEQGDYAQSLAYHQKSLALFDAVGDQAGSARTLHNIAVLQLDQGNYAQALEYGQKTLRLRETLGDKPGMAKTLAHLGNVYYEQGDYPRAMEYHQRSLTLRQALNDKEGIASALNSIGGIEAEQGKYAQAVGHIRQSRTLCEEIGFKLGVASALGFLSTVYQKQGQQAQALEFAERAAVVARQMGDNNRLQQVRYVAGMAHRALRNPAEARLAFEESIRITESLRNQIAGGEEDQQRYFASKVSPYHAMVDLLLAEGHPAEALGYAERTKARALLDVLHQGRVSIQKAMTPAEQEQERRLKAELTQFNAQLADAAQSDAADARRASELKSRLEKARLHYEAFQTTLYAAHPELKIHRGEAPIIKAEELAALLPSPGSALLEYVVTEEATHLFAITKAAEGRADVQVYKLPVKRAELAGQVEGFRRQLAGRDLGFRTTARRLYDLLLKPAQLRGKTDLVIVPDDRLWELPFQALLADNGHYVLEDSAVAYAPSLTVLREMAKSRRPQAASAQTLLAFGNPAPSPEAAERSTLALRNEKLGSLPEAEAEVRVLGQLYGAAHSHVYVGASAREDLAKAEAGKFRILHFATHGVLNNAAPMYSHLVLSQGGAGEDGLLEAWELMRLDLKADLAVLSACETARGRFGAGEGMIGLTWALFVAGVPTTVVSQWKVESAGTRELMLAFHRQLRAPADAKVTKAEALRQAALKLMKNPETSHPFYWAGFVLVGDGR